VLNQAKTVAIVGLSPNELRASYFVGFYLKRHGYTVIPVNPRESGILGESCLRRLADVPVKIDRRQRVPRARRAAGHRAGGRRDRRRTLWCQFGVINQEGRAHREAGGSRWSWIAASRSSTRACRPHALARLQHRRITSVRGGLQ
jgi:predicted CoA-binding protein